MGFSCDHTGAVVYWGAAGTTAAEVWIRHLWPFHVKGLEILVMHNQEEKEGRWHWASAGKSRKGFSCDHTGAVVYWGAAGTTAAEV